MGYTSYFSGGGSVSTKAQPNNSGGNTGAGGKGGYTSFFGTKVQAAPTSDQLKQIRQKQQQDDQVAKQKQQQDAQKQQQQDAQRKSGNLFNKVKNFATNTVVKPVLNTVDKSANTIQAAGTGVIGLDKAAIDLAHGDKRSAASTATKASKSIDSTLAHGTGNAGGYLTPQQAAATGGGTKSLVKNFVKPTVKATADVAPLVLPVGGEVKGASMLGRVAYGAAANAGVGAASTAASEAADGKFKPKDILKGAAYGAALGAGGQLFHEGASHAIDSNTAKSVHSIMDKVHAPKELIQNAKTQSLLSKATADTAEKNKVAATKVDQKIELINAKKADGKFTNVDKVKVQQLKQEKQQLTAPAAATQTAKAPAITEPLAATKPVVADSKPPLAATKAADGVPTNSVPKIKAYGQEIELSEKNGYQATDTPSGKIYSKVARTGRNNKDSNLSMNYYDANGSKLTHEQAQAAINSAPVKSTASETVAAAPNSATVKELPTKTKTNDQLPQDQKPVTTAPTEPSTRTLKPSETAHMPEIAGYTHSTHLAQDYADMLRGQELSAKGGQMVKNADGSYKRISEHSRFYRDVYKETGKAPTKADYLEESKKQLENNKDGIGAGDDYKKLLEREGKPVPRVQVASTVKDVPQGTSRVAQRIAADIKKQFGEQYKDGAKYDRVSIADQAKKAEALTNDRAMLDKVISGEKPLPDGLRATSVITAVRHDPELLKDGDLLKRLASSPLASESSYSAQELRLAAENARHDPVTAIRSIQNARAKAFEKKTGKTVDKAVNNEIKQIRDAKPTIRPKDWESLIDSLKC